jgi:hypothetical protein
MSVRIRDIVPSGLAELFQEGSQIGVGYDVATTEKKKSNPNAVAITEKVFRNFHVRFLLRWKTSDDEVAMEILKAVLMSLAPRRARRLSIDASSEKFFATRVRRELVSMVPVELVVNGATTQYLGEDMSFKVYLGNLLVNTIDDNAISLPNESWLKKDLRSVKRDKGSFVAELDENGNHGDCFDAIKLSLHSLVGSSGPAEGGATQVGTFGAHNAHRRSLNPFAHLFKGGGRKINV